MEIRLKREKHKLASEFSHFMKTEYVPFSAWSNKITRENDVPGFIVCLFVCFSPLLFLSYFGLELYFLCLRRTIDARRLKGFQGTQENQQGPNCLELKIRISSENWSSGNHQVGTKWGFHSKFLWECKMWIFYSTTSGWHL